MRSRAERVEVAAASFLLRAPTYVPTERVQHRGRIAVALDAAATWHDNAPALWLDGKPYVFLRAEARAFMSGSRLRWPVAPSGSPTTVARCTPLLGVDVDSDGLLVLDVEHAVG